MPELPEVEVVRRGSDRWFRDRWIEQVTVRHPRSVRRHIGGPDDFIDQLVNQRFGRFGRRGKYMWFALSADHCVVVHLGMSGQIRVCDPMSQADAHERIRITFADGGEALTFRDQRTFGGMHVDDLDEKGIPQTLRHIALDPLDPDFDAIAVVARIRSKRSPIKNVLLDQSVVSGIGNIYADEALWRARLHWGQPAISLTPRTTRQLLDQAASVMRAALEQGGTSFDSLYVNVNGQSGYFSRQLDAYGREGSPCRRCGTLIRREKYANRSSFRCPKCQRIR